METLHPDAFPCSPTHGSGVLQKTFAWADRPHIATWEHYTKRIFPLIVPGTHRAPESYVFCRGNFVGEVGPKGWNLWVYGVRGRMHHDTHHLPAGANTSAFDVRPGVSTLADYCVFSPVDKMRGRSLGKLPGAAQLTEVLGKVDRHSSASHHQHHNHQRMLMLGQSVWRTTHCSTSSGASIALMTHMDPRTPQHRRDQVEGNRKWYADAHANVASCISSWMPMTHKPIYARFPIVWALLYGGLIGRPSFAWVMSLDFDILILSRLPSLGAVLTNSDADFIVGRYGEQTPHGGCLQYTALDAVSSTFEHLEYPAPSKRLLFNNGVFLMRKSETSKRVLEDMYFHALAQEQNDPYVMNHVTNGLPSSLLRRVAVAPPGALDTHWVTFHNESWMIHFNGLSGMTKYKVLDATGRALHGVSGRVSYDLIWTALRRAWNEQLTKMTVHTALMAAMWGGCRWCDATLSVPLACDTYTPPSPELRRNATAVTGILVNNLVKGRDRPSSA